MPCEANAFAVVLMLERFMPVFFFFAWFLAFALVRFYIYMYLEYIAVIEYTI